MDDAGNGKKETERGKETEREHSLAELASTEHRKTGAQDTGKPEHRKHRKTEHRKEWENRMLERMEDSCNRT